MSDPLLSHGVCPQCQAELTLRAKFCWLCGTPVSTGDKISVQPIAAHKPPSSQAIIAILPVAIVLLAILGTYLESPQLGLLLAVLLCPALLITYAKSWSRKRRSRPETTTAPSTANTPMTGNDKAATFFTSVFVTFLTVVGTTFVAVCVIAVYAFVLFASLISALFQLCGITKTS